MTGDIVAVLFTDDTRRCGIIGATKTGCVVDLVGTAKPIDADATARALVTQAEAKAYQRKLRPLEKARSQTENQISRGKWVDFLHTTILPIDQWAQQR